MVMSGYAASMVRSHERLRRVIGQWSLGREREHGWEPGRAAPATERKRGGEKR